MPSLIEDPQKRSPYWIAVFSVSEAGSLRRIWRTTKIPIVPVQGRDVHPNGKLKTKAELYREAQEVAQAIEKAERSRRDGSATETMLRRLLSGVLERVEGRSITTHTIESWLNEWIAARERLSVNERYSNTNRRVMSFWPLWPDGGEHGLTRFLGPIS